MPKVYVPNDTGLQTSAIRRRFNGNSTGIILFCVDGAENKGIMAVLHWGERANPEESFVFLF